FDLPWHTEHTQVPVHWDGRSAEVDEDLAPLILALWQAGISTNACCQEGQPGRAWIEFTTAQDALLFLKMVSGARNVEDVPWEDALETYFHASVTEGSWEYTIPSSLDSEGSVWFPRAELPRILESVRKGL